MGSVPESETEAFVSSVFRKLQQEEDQMAGPVVDNAIVTRFKSVVSAMEYDELMSRVDSLPDELRETVMLRLGYHFLRSDGDLVSPMWSQNNNEGYRKLRKATDLIITG